MRKQQSGFTLIELVMVIVILGILAATAVPKFVDLSNDARAADVKARAGGISSASAINYAAMLTKGGHTIVDTTGGCSLTVANNLLDASSALDSTKYTVTTAAAALSVGASTSCTLKETTNNNTATFSLIGAK